jgi:hypothetical protein
MAPNDPVPLALTSWVAPTHVVSELICVTNRKQKLWYVISKKKAPQLHRCSVSEHLTLGKPVAMLLGHIWSPIEKSLWEEVRAPANSPWGTKVCSQQPCEWAILEMVPLALANILMANSGDSLGQSHSAKPFLGSWPSINSEIKMLS